MYNHNQIMLNRTQRHKLNRQNNASELLSNKWITAKRQTLNRLIGWLYGMVFNATFNNISVISWRPVLLVEANRSPLEKTTELSQVTDKL